MKRSIGVLLTIWVFICFSGVASAGIEQFAEVPPDHWAYGAIEKLAADGLVKGYSKGIARGDLCRYDMALIVAKAMARADRAGSEDKALIDKLATEFAPELDKLGIQVAKATNPTPQVAAGALAQRERLKVNINFEDKVAFVNSSRGPSQEGGYPVGRPVASRSSIGNGFGVMFNAPFGDGCSIDGRLLQLKTNVQRADSTGVLTFDRMWITDANAFGGRLEIGRMLTYVGKAGFWGNTGNSDGVGYTANTGAFTVKLGIGQLPSPPLPAVTPTEYLYGDVIYNFGKSTNLGVSRIEHGPDVQMNILHGKVGVGDGMAVNFEWAKNDARGAAHRGKTGYWVGLNSRAAVADFPPSNYMELSNPGVVGDHVWGISYRRFPAGVAGQFNRGSALSFAPPYQDVNGGGLNAIEDVRGLRFDYYYTLKRSLVLGLSYDMVRPINAAWRNNIFTSFLDWRI